MKPRLGTLGVFAAIASLGVIVGACASDLVTRRVDDVDPSTLPEDVRADYQVFATRCSKCHSLSRPLSSGIDNDQYWVTYVDRMRHQPSSGISREDTVPILRFLHYYVLQQAAAKQRRNQPEVIVVVPADHADQTPPKPQKPQQEGGL